MLNCWKTQQGEQHSNKMGKWNQVGKIDVSGRGGRDGKGKQKERVPGRSGGSGKINKGIGLPELGIFCVHTIGL